mmetsp:Transcript_8203/g.19420  ORF Transcript_8203/g.19420 Transcript_8203/m.19420 type:complete len:109 (+) Transcript_8203:2111-2437(+)
MEAKNSLENYAYNIRNTVRDDKLKDKIEEEDKKTIEEKVKEVLEFIETNEDLEKEEYEEKEKNLKNLANPIISKLYQQGSVPDMGNFNGQQTEGAEGANMGPKIEEVD